MKKNLILKQQEILREDLFAGIISFQQFEQASLALQKKLERCSADNDENE